MLCVEKDSGRIKARSAVLEGAGYKVIATDGVENALRIFVSRTIDAVLLDEKFGTGKKDSLGALMTNIRPQVPIILLRSDHTHVRSGIFSQVFRKRDGNRALLRVLQNLVGAGPAKKKAKAAGN